MYMYEEWEVAQPQPGDLSSNHGNELSNIYKTHVKMERTKSRLTSGLHACTYTHTSQKVLVRSNFNFKNELQGSDDLEQWFFC